MWATVPWYLSRVKCWVIKNISGGKKILGVGIGENLYTTHIHIVNLLYLRAIHTYIYTSLRNSDDGTSQRDSYSQTKTDITTDTA